MAYLSAVTELRSMKLNKEWHLKHPMPKHATLSQRIQWHMEHQKHCSCRPVPINLLKEMAKGVEME